MEKFIASSEWKGLQESAKVLDVKLAMNEGFIRIDKHIEGGHYSHSILPEWNDFDKHFWVPVILKFLNVAANYTIPK